MTLEEQNTAVIERAVERMNDGDLQGYLEMYADDLTLHGYPPDVEGKAGATAFYTAFYNGLADLKLSIEDAIADGDTVAVRYRIRGKHEGEFMGVPASGNKVDLSGQSFFRFDDGRVVERWQALDGATLLQQLGALPSG